METKNETKKIMRNAIKSYAEKRGEQVINTQIKIYTNCEKATPSYKILTAFSDECSEEITLKELMLVPKVDWTGKSVKAELFVAPTIKNILKRLGKEHEKEVTKVSVYIATSDINCDDLKLILCIDNEPFKRLKFSDILD